MLSIHDRIEIGSGYRAESRVESVIRLFRANRRDVSRQSAVHCNRQLVDRDSRLSTKTDHLSQGVNPGISTTRPVNPSLLSSQRANRRFDLRLDASLARLILESAEFGPIVLQRNLEAAHLVTLGD